MAKARRKTFGQKLGRRIWRARDARELSRAALSEKAGVHKNIVYRWEHGRSTPGAKNLAGLSKALRISSDKLLGLRGR